MKSAAVIVPLVIVSLSAACGPKVYNDTWGYRAAIPSTPYENLQKYQQDQKEQYHPPEQWEISPPQGWPKNHELGDTWPVKYEAPPPPRDDKLQKYGGETDLRAPTHVKQPRIGAIAERAYIYDRPAAVGLPLGYVRLGTSAPLVSLDKVEGKDCPRGYHKVAPKGYICADPRKTTVNLDDPYFRALAELAPRQDVAFPYRYAFSNGAPMYSRVPTPAEQAKSERDLAPAGTFVQLAEWSRGHEELISTDAKEKIVPTDPVPAIFVNHDRAVGGNGAYDPNRLVWRFIPNGSMLAYGKAFESDGRTWLVTPDLMIVPADRVRPFRKSSFKGVRIEGNLKLPLAWNRAKTPKKRFSRGDDGAMTESTDAIAPKSFVQITGESVLVKGKTYWAIRGDASGFVAAEDVTLTRTLKKLPRAISPGQKWIEARIGPGTLTAYEGDKPVYATLFSPGKGGAPAGGLDPYVHSMTKTGVFPIEWKDAVSVMSPDKEWPPKTLWFSEVPHIQYLRAPLAMHVSYWHEDFGNLKSAECVNVSPEDGLFLFSFTDPPLPEGWGGVRPGGGMGKATPVVITAL